MICLSRSDLNLKRSEESKETRTNYNKLITVKNNKINCNEDGEYDLTLLCYKRDYPTSLYCTLPTGQRIQLNPQ